MAQLWSRSKKTKYRKKDRVRVTSDSNSSASMRPLRIWKKRVASAGLCRSPGSGTRSPAARGSRRRRRRPGRGGRRRMRAGPRSLSRSQRRSRKSRTKKRSWTVLREQTKVFSSRPDSRSAERAEALKKYQLIGQVTPHASWDRQCERFEPRPSFDQTLRQF